MRLPLSLTAIPSSGHLLHMFRHFLSTSRSFSVRWHASWSRLSMEDECIQLCYGVYSEKQPKRLIGAVGDVRVILLAVTIQIVTASALISDWMQEWVSSNFPQTVNDKFLGEIKRQVFCIRKPPLQIWPGQSYTVLIRKYSGTSFIRTYFFTPVIMSGLMWIPDRWIHFFNRATLFTWTYII